MGKLLIALAALGACACARAAPEQSANATQPKAAPPAEAAAPVARGVEDPRAFVAATYAAYRASNNATPNVDFAYSPRLAALFRDYAAAQSPDEVGSIDFDWWVNGQDWEISEPALTQADQGPDRRLITARFTNLGTAETIRFGFVRENGRWYLDDVLGGSGDEGWTLSALLRERP
ncbi:MAG: hypothetical protein QOJ53_835 [Sphingomonadales bacterium]|jgi:hypothetical protein|nr:hypothetical protein [Sphingomonadales bacterium]